MCPAEINAAGWNRMYVSRVLMLRLTNPDPPLLAQRITAGIINTLASIMRDHNFLLNPSLRGLWLAFNMPFADLSLSVRM